MSHFLVLTVILVYLMVLFGVAYFTERQLRRGVKKFPHSYIYALSMAVYCSAWTFYGSIGLAADSGLQYLTTYLGPLLVAPLSWFVIRKMIRIARVKSINSLADFIAARYGKSGALGRIVTLVCLISIIPYLSLQIKAIAQSIEVLVNTPTDASTLPKTYIWGDIAFYVTLLLAVFSIVFGSLNFRTNGKHRGLVAVIAFESAVKLLMFLLAGVYVCFVLFDGLPDLFQQASALPELEQLLVMNLESPAESSLWMWRILLSALAFLMLPRQFQVMVLENESERHLTRSIWLFPLYLLAINFFVLPIALAGRMLLTDVPADMYILYLPLQEGNYWITLCVFIGGFSAATGMIIVSTVALSTMLSNNFLTPHFIPIDIKTDVNRNAVSYITIYQRLSIIFVLFLAYAYYRYIAHYFSLVSIGLTAFVVIAQLAPAVLLGLYWKRGNVWGVSAGLFVGIFLWGYTLILPSFFENHLIAGTLDLPHWLNPHHLFDFKHLDPINHALFWSLLGNTLTYVVVSFATKSSAAELNQAEIFVKILNYERMYEKVVAWSGTAYVGDLQRLLEFFVGEKAASEAFQKYSRRKAISLQRGKLADKELLTYIETLLTGVIGAASARVMVSSVIQENETMRLEDVMTILQESQSLLSDNRELRKKTNELRTASEKLFYLNQKLREQSRIRNDFVSTVTHELRTPLTSIRALSEIVYEHEDMEHDERQYFVGQIVTETERLTHLINEILDLERFESGKITLNRQPQSILAIIKETIASAKPLLESKNITLSTIFQLQDGEVEADKERLIQVTLNLLSNAIKHCDPQEGVIEVSAQEKEGELWVAVKDNGQGISPANHQVIFEKFHQVRNQDNRKPQGTGLGLSIAKQIVEMHTGELWVESELGKGATFRFKVPLVCASPE